MDTWRNKITVVNEQLVSTYMYTTVNVDMAFMDIECLCYYAVDTDSWEDCYEKAFNYRDLNNLGPKDIELKHGTYTVDTRNILHQDEKWHNFKVVGRLPDSY